MHACRHTHARTHTHVHTCMHAQTRFHAHTHARTQTHTHIGSITKYILYYYIYNMKTGVPLGRPSCCSSLERVLSSTLNLAELLRINIKAAIHAFTSPVSAKYKHYFHNKTTNCPRFIKLYYNSEGMCVPVKCCALIHNNCMRNISSEKSIINY